ncbi:uncharacterized protein LOC144135233 [Amblyomma americanum]
MQLRLPEDPPDEFERRSSSGRARKARYPDKSWKEKAKARRPDSMIQTLVSNSPPGPPPILEGEQVRNMPRPQAYPVPGQFKRVLPASPSSWQPCSPPSSDMWRTTTRKTHSPNFPQFHRQPFRFR